MIKALKLFNRDFLSAKRPLVWIIGVVLFTLVVHMAFISLISFFHFSLTHSLSVIDDWIDYHGWELLIIVKLVVLLTFNRIFYLGLPKNFFFIEFKNSFGDVSRDVVLITFQIIFVSLLLSQVSYSGFLNYGPRELFMSLIGNFIESLINIYIVVSLIRHYELNSSKILFWLLSTFILHYSTYLIFSFVDHFSWHKLFSYFFVYSIFLRKKKSWADILFFIFFSVSIYCVFIGEDSIWGNMGAPFIAGHILRWYELLTLFIVSTLFYNRYHFYRRRS